MRSLHELKPYFLKYLKPVAGECKKRKITPIQLMMGSCGLSLIAGLIMAAGASFHSIFLILPLVLGIRLILNAIDELLIKGSKTKSDMLFYLGEMGDVFTDIVLYLPLMYIPGISQILIIFNVLAAIFTEFVGVMGHKVSQKRHYEGPMGKTDRALAFSIVAILYAFSVIGVGITNALLTVIFLAQALTIYNRVMGALTK